MVEWKNVIFGFVMFLFGSFMSFQLFKILDDASLSFLNQAMSLKNYLKRMKKKKNSEEDNSKTVITNKRLLEVCQSILGNITNIAFANEADIPNKVIYDIAAACKKYIKPKIRELELEPCIKKRHFFSSKMIVYEKIEPRITERELFCSNAVGIFILEKEYRKALHEFMDCIDNHGQAAFETREMTCSEAVLYHNMASMFMEALKPEEQEKIK